VPEAQQGRVRAPFRVLAWVVGPLCLATGLWALGDSLYVLVTDGWSAFRANVEITSIGTAGVFFGIMFLRAARTGSDPMSPSDE
jgi:hypothetical protein